MALPREDLETVAEGMAMLAEEEARSERSSARSSEVSVLAGALPSPKISKPMKSWLIVRASLAARSAQVLEAFLGMPERTSMIS